MFTFVCMHMQISMCVYICICIIYRCIVCICVWHTHTHIHIKNIYICITIYILKKEPKGETYICIISPPCDQCKRSSKNISYPDATVTKGRCKRAFSCLWLQLHVSPLGSFFKNIYGNAYIYTCIYFLYVCVCMSFMMFQV
jgi:hypothetical protein